MIVNDLYNNEKPDEVISIVSNEVETAMLELLAGKIIVSDSPDATMSLAIAYEKICASQNERTRVLYDIKDRMELHDLMRQVHENE